jgi:hypothetical protein
MEPEIKAKLESYPEIMEECVQMAFDVVDNHFAPGSVMERAKLAESYARTMFDRATGPDQQSLLELGKVLKQAAEMLKKPSPLIKFPTGSPGLEPFGIYPEDKGPEHFGVTEEEVSEEERVIDPRLHPLDLSRMTFTAADMWRMRKYEILGIEVRQSDLPMGVREVMETGRWEYTGKMYSQTFLFSVVLEIGTSVVVDPDVLLEGFRLENIPFKNIFPQGPYTDEEINTEELRYLSQIAQGAVSENADMLGGKHSISEYPSVPFRVKVGREHTISMADDEVIPWDDRASAQWISLKKDGQAYITGNIQEDGMLLLEIHAGVKTTHMRCTPDQATAFIDTGIALRSGISQFLKQQAE